MHVQTLWPTHGPVTGSSLVSVKGVNFVNVPNLRCKFNTTVVVATFVSSTHILCMSTAPLRPPPAPSVRVEVTANQTTPQTAWSSLITVHPCELLVSFLLSSCADAANPLVRYIIPYMGPWQRNGTKVEMHGAGFINSAEFRCKFTMGATVIINSAVWRAATYALCYTPYFGSAGAATVELTNNAQDYQQTESHSPTMVRAL